MSRAFDAALKAEQLGHHCPDLVVVVHQPDSHIRRERLGWRRSDGDGSGWWRSGGCRVIIHTQHKALPMPTVTCATAPDANHRKHLILQGNSASATRLQLMHSNASMVFPMTRSVQPAKKSTTLKHPAAEQNRPPILGQYPAPYIE